MAGNFPLTLKALCVETFCDHLTEIAHKIPLKSSGRGGGNGAPHPILSAYTSFDLLHNIGEVEFGGDDEEEHDDQYHANDDEDDGDEGEGEEGDIVDEDTPATMDSSTVYFPATLNRYRYRLPDDCFLPANLAECLLERLVERNMLNDSTISMFDAAHTVLHRIRLNSLKNQRCLRGLKILGEHRLVELQCSNFKYITVGSIIDCLNEWSVANLLSANFEYCTFIENLTRHSFMVKLTSLKNLRNLNLAHTELNQVSFEMVCEDLVFLERFNVSGTLVDDARPLLNLKNTLKALIIADLPRIDNLPETLAQLIDLRHLDVSLERYFIRETHTVTLPRIPCHFIEFLKRENNSNATPPLPALLSLDLSGWGDYTPLDLIEEFLDTHPQLEFIGLTLNRITSPTVSMINSKKFLNTVIDDEEEVEDDYNKNAGLLVAGLANEHQILTTLRTYKTRHIYVQHALKTLFQITQNRWRYTSSGEFNARTNAATCNGSSMLLGKTKDAAAAARILRRCYTRLFDAVLDAMHVHGRRVNVQVAASACLYNLTRNEGAKSMTAPSMQRCVACILNAMKRFPYVFQLQKNALLTLCNDTILQDVHFDRFKCTSLVLDTLVYDEPNIVRMAVAVSSILAAKLSTKETTRIGTNTAYMGKLLLIVCARRSQADVTLNFALGTLWNLTDESAETCAAFLDNDGLDIYLNVLATFKECVSVEIKVLGLLNNIAEVVELRAKLMIDRLFCGLFELLHSPHIDVSYFAAGILAHLASDGASVWTSLLGTFSREHVLDELEKTITNWKIPDNEMVAYRSFRPFWTLLKVNVEYQIQLWAVWAIQHVCIKNPSRYCPVLKIDNGEKLIDELLASERTHPIIRKYCESILSLAKSF